MNNTKAIKKIREAHCFPADSMDYLWDRANMVGEVNTLNMLEYVSRLEVALAALDQLTAEPSKDQCLIDKHGGSVLPMVTEDGSVVLVGSISGGANYTDGEPNGLTLILIDPQGNERHARYIRKLAAELSGDARVFARSLGTNGVYNPLHAAALITARDERIRRGCADRGVKWCNSPLDELGEHEDDDEWWNNGLRAAIMGRKE